MIPQSLDLGTLRAAYREGLSPREVLAAIDAREAALDDPGIYIARLAAQDRDVLLAALGPFDPVSKPLWGIPFAIKDNIDCAGLPTTAACPAFAKTPERSAEVVRRLVEAGAIPIGKTNLDQFATGLVGVRTPYPVPRNAFDAALVPGGSSSGSAVAVAQGLVSFALGTDTAGSGRVPAGLNNIVGLKPTLGAIPVRGVLPACQTLDCVSVFALTVPDAWQVLAAAAGYDAADPWSRKIALGAPAALAAPLRLGVPNNESRVFLGDAAAESAFEAALALAGDLGHSLVETDLAPFFAVARLLYDGPWVAERYQALRGFMGDHAAAMHPVTLAITRGAEKLSAADAFAGLYRLAELRRATEPVWGAVDALFVPTFPRPPTLAEVAADPIGPNAGLGTYTNFVNLLDLCALAVPGPFRADGLPAGATLIAPAGQDAVLAGLGQTLHAAAGVPLGATRAPQPHTGFAPPPADPSAIELCVVGAHLSGLPLNRELLALGGRLLRSVRTQPDYALYALPGTSPAKPGLIRVAEGGAAIETEVWALSPDAFGRFVAAIPPPLGIGSIRLADGSTPKGFLCEPVAVAGAADVSHFGGWRNYIAAAAQ